MNVKRWSRRVSDALAKMAAWGAQILGLTAFTGGACACCGQPVCPCGLAQAGLLGGAIAFCLRLWKKVKHAGRRGQDR